MYSMGPSSGALRSTPAFEEEIRIALDSFRLHSIEDKLIARCRLRHGIQFSTLSSEVPKSLVEQRSLK